MASTGSVLKQLKQKAEDSEQRYQKLQQERLGWNGWDAWNGETQPLDVPGWCEFASAREGAFKWTIKNTNKMSQGKFVIRYSCMS